MVAIVSAKRLPRLYLAGIWGLLSLSKTAPGIQIRLQKCHSLGHSMLKDSLTELCCGASLLVFAFLCFFSLSWVLLGALSSSLARFGTSVAILLGLPQGFRGLSWTFLSLLGPLFGCPWACLGCSRAYFGASWAALGLPFAALLAQDAARRQQGAPRETPKSPQRTKTDP